VRTISVEAPGCQAAALPGDGMRRRFGPAGSRRYNG
jgi:hypothetical protein